MPTINYIGTVSDSGITYGITSTNTLIVENAAFAHDRHIVIPEQVGGMPVVGVGTAAFQNSQELRSISLPATVTEIGTYAFSRCTNLKNVKFAAPEVALGCEAFSNCGNLKLVDGVAITTRSDRAFYRCYKLEKISATFVGYIYTKTFGNCPELKELSFKNVHFRGEVFFGCRGLETLYFDENAVIPDEMLSHIGGLKIICSATSSIADLVYDGISVIIKEDKPFA